MFAVPVNLMSECHKAFHGVRRLSFIHFRCSHNMAAQSWIIKLTKQLKNQRTEWPLHRLARPANARALPIDVYKLSAGTAFCLSLLWKRLAVEPRGALT